MQAHCAKGFSKNIELHVLVKNVRYPPADLNTCPKYPKIDNTLIIKVEVNLSTQQILLGSFCLVCSHCRLTRILSNSSKAKNVFYREVGFPLHWHLNHFVKQFKKIVHDEITSILTVFMNRKQGSQLIYILFNRNH